jgi:RNA polymerase sigma factor (sigma-70 family)
LSDSFRFFAQQRVWSEQDAEDIVQDTLATIAGKYKGIDFETSFAAWAYRILENKILEYYRKKQCHESKFAQISSTGSDSFLCEPDPIFQDKLLNCLKMINTANNRHARVLNLRYQGYTTGEICDRLEMTRNSMYTVLSRARSMLKLCLHKGDIG